MMLSRISGVTALLALLLSVWAPLASSQPGSGSADITLPDDVVAGSSGTWSITYTAAQAFKNGTITVTVPAGWTTPQTGSNVSAGYVSVSTKAWRFLWMANPCRGRSC